MILSVFRKKPDTASLRNVYASIVAQSRQKFFYADWGVADSVNGRFDMISLHMCLVLRRLKAAGDAEREFSQGLFDLFFKDMDRSLREMGAGDMAVPKRIQKMGELFYGMLASVSAALDENDTNALSQSLIRNIYDGQETGSVSVLTRYIQNLDDSIKDQKTTVILKGVIVLEAIEKSSGRVPV